MTDYQALYTTLFNAITDAINILHEAQEKAERMYIESGGQKGKVIKFPEGTAKKKIE